MTSLRFTLGQYLALRRALGFRLVRQGKALERFVAFAERECATSITSDLALRWARLPERANQTTLADRLGNVRRFALYCSAFDPSTEIPPDGLIPYSRHRREPHIWTRKEVRSLMAGARRIPSPRGLRALTYQTLFGLIAVAGLRINEALHLDNADVDWSSAVLAIRNTKFGKTRYVPVDPSTIAALGRYVRKRDHVIPHRDAIAFFVTEAGARLSESALRGVFSRLRKMLPRRTRSRHRAPRMHDLRHTFAVDTLRRWYRTGRDVEALLPRLSTYLGHAHVNDTYWYLTAIPDLLAAAARRLERETGRCLP